MLLSVIFTRIATLLLQRNTHFLVPLWSRPQLKTATNQHPDRLLDSLRHRTEEHMLDNSLTIPLISFYNEDLNVDCSVFVLFLLLKMFGHILVLSYPNMLTQSLPFLSHKIALFGFFSYTCTKADQFFVISLISPSAKYHIHKSQISHCKPYFLISEKELKLHVFTIKYSTNKKAIKIVDIWTQ